MAKDDTHFGKIPAFAADYLTRLTGFEARVYMLLALRCDWHSRELSISYKAVAAALGNNDGKQAEDAINALVRYGLVVKRRGKKGVSNRYYLPLRQDQNNQGGISPLPPDNQGGISPQGRGEYPPKVGGNIPPHYKRSNYKNPIQEAQRAQPQGQAGAAPDVSQCHEGGVCPECGAPAVGEGCCPSCGWDYGQMTIPAEGAAANPGLDMCPECGLALQPDGTCWRHGKPSLEKKGKEKDI